MPAKASGGSESFHGEVSGLSLPDLIQLNTGSNFCGCMTVQYGDQAGLLFFRDGRIVHAEQGDRSGEGAFYQMMEWPTGRFTLQPNVSTTRHTVEKSPQHLLVEALRLLDERRAGREGAAAAPQPQPPAAPRARAATSSSDLVERLGAVPGVADVVLMGKDGACVEEPTWEREQLAARAAYLAMIGNQLGATFRAGSLRSALLQSDKGHLLLLAARNHYLATLIQAAEAGPVEARIRKALGGSA